jgi:hypothetical protein
VDDAHGEDAARAALGEVLGHEILHLGRAEPVQIEHAVDRECHGRFGIERLAVVLVVVFEVPWHRDHRLFSRRPGRAVGAAVVGSSGQSCFGYRARSRLRTSG